MCSQKVDNIMGEMTPQANNGPFQFNLDIVITLGTGYYLQGGREEVREK